MDADTTQPMRDLLPATAVIVHYGPLGPTMAQIFAVKQWARQVVVVANDGSADPLNDSDPTVRWITPSRNLGYGGAANASLLASDQAILVLLNSDITMPADVARQACGVVLDGQVGIVGLRMNAASNTFLSGAGTLSRFLLLGQMREPTTPLQDCEWVTGAAMFISRQCLEQVRFEERYFLGVEDIDFCVRASEQGYRTAVLSRPGVIHDDGKVIGATRWYYYSIRNPIWFLRARRGLPLASLLVSRALLLLGRVAIADLCKRRGWARSKLMALGILHGAIRYLPPGSPPFPWEPVEVPSRVERASTRRRNANLEA